eukprot:Gregarina_sp_Poly_1__5126@NODE_2712_length_1793_cov_76_588644_g1720_i0_p1_GENE_NODE_2712_length_1793_cov_76_588644_g1720_i0NODE_2712_length_1793_cov_76_588644_g1720_i0_p1_ORF_typecomplete_len143_score9_56Hydrolase_3/PF08282_12/1_5e16DUF1894/PF08979_11/0_051IL3/PF02059_15/0_53IL3/PF02059_15/2e03_NODE_2712_length_1793_cov_76_588644_g1720_i012851713
MKVGWIASDMDGTFLNANHTVSKESIKIYFRLQSLNYCIIPATGRSLAGLKQVILENNPDFYPQFKFFPGIYFNGTMIFGENENDILYQASVDRQILIYFAKACYGYFDSKGTANNLTMLLQHSAGSFTDVETKVTRGHVAP